MSYCLEESTENYSGERRIKISEKVNIHSFFLPLDLNTSTHLNSEPALLANRFSTLSTSFSDLTSRHQPLSAEVMLENSQTATMRKTLQSAMSRKDSESAVNRCLSPSKVGYKQSDRLHSSLSPQHCLKESNKEASVLLFSLFAVQKCI